LSLHHLFFRQTLNRLLPAAAMCQPSRCDNPTSTLTHFFRNSTIGGINGFPSINGPNITSAVASNVPFTAPTPTFSALKSSLLSPPPSP
jgi:hypothetical protein